MSLCSNSVAALEKGGANGYMEHLGNFLKSASLSTTRPDPVHPVRFLVPREREAEIMKVPLEERGAAVHIGMHAETLSVPGTDGDSGCQCTSCFSMRDENPDGREGQGLFYLANVPVLRDNPLRMTNNFCTFIGMLSELPQYFLGVSCPAAYLGAPHALFSFHIEDMSLWSWNFLHDGEPKCWCVAQVNFLCLSFLKNDLSPT